MNLPQPKSHKPLFDRRSLFFSLTVLLLFIIQGIFIWFMPRFHMENTASGWSQQLRELGNKLNSAGVQEEAIHQYERYLEQNTVTGPTRANISYSLGKMYMDLGKYDKALAWFYQVELADPHSELKAEAGSRIVNCLERLGKFQAAQYALGARSSLNPDHKDQGGTLVAKIGQDEIYLHEIDEALAKLPPWLAEQYKGQDNRTEFLKKYVADELLYRKAVKLEYDKDTDITQKLQQVLKELMIQKLIETEIKDKIAMDDTDLNNYYLAHKEQYNRRERAKISLLKLKTKSEADEALKELTSGKSFAEVAKSRSLDTNTRDEGGLFPNWITRGEDTLGIGQAEQVSAAIFNSTPDKPTEPLKVGDFYYIFMLKQHEPGQESSFEEAKSQVQKDYYAEKFQQAYQELIQTTLQAEDVKLFPEAIK
jgi:parvulin-like peptidyl-prolyl isomerase